MTFCEPGSPSKTLTLVEVGELEAAAGGGQNRHFSRRQTLQAAAKSCKSQNDEHQSMSQIRERRDFTSAGILSGIKLLNWS